jgi:hypothetical protein
LAQYLMIVLSSQNGEQVIYLDTPSIKCRVAMEIFNDISIQLMVI